MRWWFHKHAVKACAPSAASGLADRLRNLWMFATSDDGALEDLAKMFYSRTLMDKNTLHAAGDAADSMHFVVNGMIVERTPQSKDINQAHLDEAPVEYQVGTHALHTECALKWAASFCVRLDITLRDAGVLVVFANHLASAIWLNRVKSSTRCFKDLVDKRI